MNKRLIYICLFYFFSISASNAKFIGICRDSGVYISINGAYSIPLGYFKSTTYSSGEFALNGYGANITLEHPLKPGWLGAAFEGGYYVNPFNSNAYKEATFPVINEYSFLGTSPYKETVAIVGPFFETEFKKITIELKGMLGLAINTPAEVSLVYNNNGLPPLTYLPNTLPALSSNFFCYYLETSVRYALTKHVIIRGNISYINDFGPEYKYFSTRAPISSLNLGAGMGYRFGK